MAGLSLRELSQRLQGKVSHASLAKYEQDLMMPNSTLLNQLAKELDQPLDFFFRPREIELAEIRFRKLSGLPRTTEAAVEARAQDYFERYGQIEAVLGLSEVFKNPLISPGVEILEDADEKAIELRKCWSLGLDPIPDVIDLLESKGIKIQEIQISDRHFDGLSAWTNAGPVIVIASWLNENLLRKRMTTVHELAHLLLEMPDQVNRKLEERMVARFAGAWLMPKTSFRREFGRHRKAITLHELIQMKLTFGVSITAIIMRAHQLKLINDVTFKRFWSGWGKEWKKAQKEPGDSEYMGRERPCRFSQLVYRAAAEEMITLSKGASLLNERLGVFRKELQKVCR